MGHRSRDKRARRIARQPASEVDPALEQRKTYQSLVRAFLFVIGMYVASFGIGACQFSRWNHRENALIHPIFHPWAIVLGAGIIILALIKRK